MQQRILICIVIIAILGHLKAENVRLTRELHNLKGTVRDQALTMQHLTDPDVIARRTFARLLGEPEEAVPVRVVRP